MLPRKSSTDAQSVPRVEESAPPEIGIKLLAANFAPLIAALSALDEIMLCESADTVIIIIINPRIVVYHFFTDAEAV
jgi:hypothetical protein